MADTKPPRKKANPYAKAIAAYYQTLKEYAQQYALHEGAVSTAFQTLLADTARPNHWTLIPQLGDKTAGIRPDGTLKDMMLMPRGHWEAKDTKDKLDVEIGKKIKAGYPLGNIIFEDTREAVLIQNKAEVMRIDLSDAEKLARLLDQFYAYIEPQIEGFENAVNEFKDRVPDLAKALKAKVLDAHDSNKPFKEAFARFFELCQTSLNPNIAKDAVDDMLVQHLLTERLIREIFDNPEFTQRNVIAQEIEKVVAALTSKSFNRDVFLKSLDRFYVAIENAARTITDWSDKQHFLNTVYERFFQGYSVKLADTMGIVYTPQPIVDFMCASVAEVLDKEFGKTLGDKDVHILDPCTGTGNFIVNLMKRIPKRDLPRVYKQQMFANEIMLLPYYIAAMNIEHAYYELTGEYESFEGLCFVDTLDLAEEHVPQFSFMTAKNTERVERQKKSPITVVIGNPPYNMSQANENDNNKNRNYRVVEQRIKDTYIKNGTATNVNKLADPYVKFFRWASDRLADRSGIVCFVSNNGFIDQRAFDGMRITLQSEFSAIYHVDLHGNVRENTKLSGTTHNVFGIQVGVGITIAVKRSGTRQHRLQQARVPEEWRREQKLNWLDTQKSIAGVKWQLELRSPARHWTASETAGEFETFVPMGDKAAKAANASRSEAIFSIYCIGVVTNRDDVVYGFDEGQLAARVTQFIEDYNGEVFRYQRSGGNQDVDDFVRYDKIKWSRDLKKDLKRGKFAEFSATKIRRATYRPFTKRLLFFDKILNQDITRWPTFFPSEHEVKENRVIVAGGYGRKPFSLFYCDTIADLNFYADPAQCFPFYVYNEDGSNRRENITDWALEQFRSHYKNKKISKWDIFHYVYGLLHHPGYRTKFADNLKRELPRIPFAPDFEAFRGAGQSLAGLHLDYEKLEPFKLQWITTDGVPLSYHVKKMKLSGKGTKASRHEGTEELSVVVNESLTLEGVPAEALEYRLGNRSALEWVIDQYQVSTDKRSGITSDPNREDDPEYIVRLVGQVVRVSVETVKIVRSLPAEFAGL